MLARVSFTQRHEELERRVRDATDQFLVGDGPALADQLAEALFVVSADVSRLRRVAVEHSPEAAEVTSIDDALSACVSLARRLSIATRSHSDPDGYTDAARIARDLGRHLAPSMPEGATLSIVCPPTPVLARMPSSELRRTLAILVRRLVVGLLASSGELVLEVVEERPRAARHPTVKVLVGHRGLGHAQAASAADAVRSDVNARGGSVEPRPRAGGGTAVVVSLPSAY